LAVEALHKAFPCPRPTD